MDIGSLLVGLALLALVAFILAQPFIERQGVRERQVTQAEALIAEREQVLEALRDLDFDHATGKITADDYAPQRARLVARGVELLKQLDVMGVLPAAAASAPGANGSAGNLEDQIEHAIAARRKAPAAGGIARGVDAQVEAAIAARRKRPAFASPPVAAVTPAAPGGTPPSATHAPACPKCGTAPKPGDRFCARCGTALPRAAAPVCAECGNTLRPDDRFCGKCGAKVPDAAADAAASGAA